MSSYKHGFEIDDDSLNPELRRTSRTEHSETIEKLSKRGFEVDEDSVQVKKLSVADVEKEEVTTVPEDSADSSDDGSELRTRFWSSPLLWFLFLVFAVGGLQVYELINSAFSRSLIAGWCWTSGISLAMLLVLTSVFKELRSVWQLRNTGRIRKKYKKILTEGNGQDAIDLCREMFSQTKVVSQESFDSFLNRVQPNFSPEEVFEIYSRTILKALDEKAKAVVVKRSRENGIVVALSPLAWLDMAFSLARSLRMIREVANVYGYRCGLWGRFELYRKIVRNIVFIGIADLTTDAITDALGAETFAKVSVAAGQGIAAGIYASRLGYMTIKAVRPLPINKKVLTLAELRRDLVTGSLKILGGSSKK